MKITFALPVLAANLALALPSHAAAQTTTLLHTFSPTSGDFTTPQNTNTDGASPNSLVLSGNTLYGTASFGGSGGSGTVFALNTDGTGFTVLYAFSPYTFFVSSCGCTVGLNADGVAPNSLSSSGNTLLGTATGCGNSAGGTVFSVNTDGTGFSVLYSFSGPDGFGPKSQFISGNTLYGVTARGGSGFDGSCGCGTGSGTIFSINTDGTSFTSLYSFSEVSTNSFGVYTNSDGSRPEALVMGNGVLYGTARFGGNAAAYDGSGTVFAINRDGTGFTVLHKFAAMDSQAQNVDGAQPFGLVLSGDTLYGTTYRGGIYGEGTIFSVATNGTRFRLLHTFNGQGYNPSSLVLAGNVLFVTTLSGSFSLDTDGTGFTPLQRASSSGWVWSPGALFGTTAANGGGAAGGGTVFALSLPFSTPQLNISRAGANAVLTWPASTALFTLESTTNVDPGGPWVEVSPPPVLVNGQNTVTNHISAAHQFFRLSQ